MFNNEKLVEEVPLKTYIEDLLIPSDFEIRLKNHSPDELRALLEMLGYCLPITGFGKNDFVKDYMYRKIADIIAHTENDKIDINIEMETGRNLHEAVKRQEEYCKLNHEETGRPTLPIMITPRYMTSGVFTLYWANCQLFSSSSLILPLSLIDGDERLKIIKYRINNNIPFTTKDKIFLNWGMYTNHSMTPYRLLNELIDIAKAYVEDSAISECLLMYYANDCERLIKDKTKRTEIYEKIKPKCSVFDAGMENAEIRIRYRLENIIEQEINKKDQQIEEQKDAYQKEINKKDKQIEELTKRIKDLENNQ